MASGNPEEVKAAHDAFVRWQQVRATQLGATINVILGLTTASVAFGVDFFVKNHTPFTLLCAWGPLALLMLAAVAGIAIHFTRLYDFRWTARSARAQEMQQRYRMGETPKLPGWLERDVSEKKRSGDNDNDIIGKIHEDYSKSAECIGSWTWVCLWIQFPAFFAGFFLLALSLMHPCGFNQHGPDTASTVNVNVDTGLKDNFVLVSSAQVRMKNGMTHTHTFLLDQTTGDVWDMVCTNGKVAFQRVLRNDTLPVKRTNTD